MLNLKKIDNLWVIHDGDTEFLDKRGDTITFPSENLGEIGLKALKRLINSKQIV